MLARLPSGYSSSMACQRPLSECLSSGEHRSRLPGLLQRVIFRRLIREYELVSHSASL